MSSPQGTFIPPILNGAQIQARLEANTPAAVQLSTGVAVTVASWLVDSYGTREGTLECTKSDGSRIIRRVFIRHDGTNAADAVNAFFSYGVGNGSHADLTDGAWADVVLSGAGTAQVINLQVTAAANGASWTAIFYPGFLKVT